MTKTTKKGFTLIELLVVIAIIGILSAIGLVALNGAREKARDAQRMNDLSQYRTALALFYDSVQMYPYRAGIDGFGMCLYNVGSTTNGFLYDGTLTYLGPLLNFATVFNTLGPLVTEFLGGTLVSPAGKPVGSNYYCYDVNGMAETGAANNLDNFLLFTQLEANNQKWYWIDGKGKTGYSTDSNNLHLINNCITGTPCTW